MTTGTPSTTSATAGTDLDPRRAELRQRFEARRGYWTAWLDELLHHSPDFFEAFLGFTSAPWNTQALTPRVKELVYIAIDAAITHLYQPGLRKHMGDAMGHGATPADIVETLQLASCIGLLSTTTGAPFLLEALQARGQAPAELTPAQTAQRERFEQATGHWDAGLDALLRLDADAFAHHAGYIAAAWQTKSLDPVTRELLSLAVHASSTLLHQPGIRLHLARALDAGATRAQVMEVLQLTSVLGIHTCSVAMPMLGEALAQRTAAAN
jgi:alkylhydroperoxidase/carboxymuconolactone decarboxylase family protein YurZ